MDSPALRLNFWRKIRAAFRKFDVKIPPISTVVISLFGLALMSYLTIRDFLPLLREYRNNNQDTNVQIIVLDPNFTVPQISLAIPHYKFYKPRSYQFNRTYLIFPIESDCFYKTAANLKSGESRPRSAMVEELLEEYRNESTLLFYKALTLKLVELALNESNGMNDVLRDFPSACRELDLHQEPRISLEGIINQTETNDSIVDYDQTDPGLPDVLRNYILPYPLFLASFNFFLHQFNRDYNFEAAHWGSVKLDALHSKLMKTPPHKLEILFTQVAKSICQQTRVSKQEFSYEFDKGHSVNRTCEDVFISSKRLLSFDYNGIWLTLENGDQSPKTEELRFEFALHERSIWFSSNEQGLTMAEGDRRFIAYADASAQYLSFLDQAYASYIYNTPPISWGNDTYGRKITIKYGVQNRARKTHDENVRRNLCFDGSSVAQCRLMCTKRKLIDGPCRCVPFGYRRGLNYSNLAPFCDAETYQECGVRENWDAFMAECLKQCQDSCDYTSYSFQVEFEQYESKTPNVREFVLKTIPVFNSFTEFTWRKKTTEEQFFAQLAGIAGLYLGFSGLSVLAGLAWIIEWLIGRLRQRKKEKRLQFDDQEMKRKWRPGPEAGTDIDRVLELLGETKKEMMEAMKDMKAEMERNWKRDLESAMAKF